MSIWWLLTIGVGINIAGFLVAYRYKSDKLTDFSYGATFIILVLIGYLANQSNLYKNTALAMVGFWAFRLAGFLLRRILAVKKDRRFNGIRENFVKFGQFWLFQGVTAWLILLPVLFLMNQPNPKATWLSWLGLVVWAFGLIIETVADEQKFTFSQNRSNKDKFISNGLWAYSRHPNYFGEIVCWIGVYLFAFAALSGWERLFGLISPFYITFLLVFVTGIPKLEAYADQKWGGQKDYQKYKVSTSILLPWPKRG